MTSLYKLLDHCGVAHTILSVQCTKAESDVPIAVTDASIPQMVSSAPAKPIAKSVAVPVAKAAVRTPPNANSSAFYQWMRNEMHLAESSSRSYASAINNCEQLARQIGLDSTALYGVSLEVATRTKRSVDCYKGIYFNQRQTEQSAAGRTGKIHTVPFCAGKHFYEKRANRF